MILLLEDNDITRGATADLLRARGLSVCEAATAEEALPILAERLPAVLVLDLVLPTIDGVSLLERLQSLPGFDRVQVVVTTALPDPLPALPGPCRVLRKPFDIDQLLQAIGDCAPQEVPRPG